MQTTHSNEHPVFGLQHPHTHTLAGKHTHTHTCRQFHNVTQAGTKVNYCNFRGKLFYALTAWGLNQRLPCVCWYVMVCVCAVLPHAYFIKCRYFSVTAIFIAPAHERVWVHSFPSENSAQNFPTWTKLSRFNCFWGWVKSPSGNN